MIAYAQGADLVGALGLLVLSAGLGLASWVGRRRQAAEEARTDG